jgi:hypothetical protein
MVRDIDRPTRNEAKQSARLPAAAAFRAALGGIERNAAHPSREMADPIEHGHRPEIHDGCIQLLTTKYYRLVSGMIDPPNHARRCPQLVPVADALKPSLSQEALLLDLQLSQEVLDHRSC